MKKVIALMMCLCMTVGMINAPVNAAQTDDVKTLGEDTYTLENYVSSLDEAMSIQIYNLCNGINNYSITVDDDVAWKEKIEDAEFVDHLDNGLSKYYSESIGSAFQLNNEETVIDGFDGKKYAVIKFDVEHRQKSIDTFFKKRAEMLEEKRKFLATMPNLEEMSDYDKILGILRYMGKINYSFDENGKTINDAYTALVNEKATCTGFANAFRYLATIVGLETREMVNYGVHSWIAIKLCGNWYEIEPQNRIKVKNDPLTQNVNLSKVLRGSNYMINKSANYAKDSNGLRESLPISHSDYMEYKKHDYSDYIIRWNGDAAVFYKTCSVCGEYENEGFSFEPQMPAYYCMVNREYLGTPCAVEKVSESKCGEATVTKYKAKVTVDGKEYTSEHTVIDGECSHVADEKVIKEATCSEEGVVQKTCENCGYVWTESIPVKEHTYETYSESVDTCSEKYDMETVKCSVCGTVKSRTMKMYYASHDYEFKEHKTLPTCTGEGEDVYECKKCGAEKTESVAALGHGETELRNVRQATCIEDGYTGDLCCKVCGEVVVKGSVIKGVHDLKPEKIEEKDVVENGRKYHVTVWRDRCEICGECFEPYENKEYVCDVETGTAPTTAIRPTTAKKPEKTTCVGKGSIKSAKNIKRCKIKLKLNKVAGAKGYQIRYATNKRFKKAVIRNSKLSYTIGKLKKGKTYYVKARAYIKSGKNKVYGKWSKAKKVKIKK